MTIAFHRLQREGKTVTHRYFDLAFTPMVRRLQNESGSGKAYGRLVTGSESADQLTELEEVFICARDSFYMATVSETGWPYLQHRGGPPGFVKVLGPSTIGFADFRGNRQYVSLGNLAIDNRAALFFMDYPAKRRLKLFARARAVNVNSEAGIVKQLTDESYGAKVERGLIFEIEAFDWNCTQHITQRFTFSEIEALNGA